MSTSPKRLELEGKASIRPASVAVLLMSSLVACQSGHSISRSFDAPSVITNRYASLAPADTQLSSVCTAQTSDRDSPYECTLELHASGSADEADLVRWWVAASAVLKRQKDLGRARVRFGSKVLVPDAPILAKRIRGDWMRLAWRCPGDEGLDNTERYIAELGRAPIDPNGFRSLIDGKRAQCTLAPATSL